MALYHVYARLTPVAPDSLALRILPLAFSLVLAFLLYPRRKGGTPDRIPWSDLLLTGLSLAALAYLFLNYAYVTSRFPTAAPLSAGDMLVAGVATLLVLEATRRTIGSALPIVAGCFITYGLLGPWVPGVRRHQGMTLEILLDQTYFPTEGIFGIPLAVAGSYVILFIIFGAFLEKSGAGQVFMKFAHG